MKNCVVLKRKNNITTLEASNVNKERAKLIATHPHDRYATYLIAEVVEIITPEILKSLRENENRESL